MRVSNDVLLKKIDLVVNKLMNLGAPEVDGDLSDKNPQEKGMIVRDFGIQEWDWPQGVGLYGLMKLEEHTKDGRFDEFLKNWYETNLEIGLPSRNINTTAPYLPLVDLLDKWNDPKYEKLCLDRVDWLMKRLPRTDEGVFKHVTSAIGDRQGVRLNENEMWIDTLFMTVLFLNKMGQRYNRQDWIDEVSTRLRNISSIFAMKRQDCSIMDTPSMPRTTSAESSGAAATAGSHSVSSIISKLSTEPWIRN